MSQAIHQIRVPGIEPIHQGKVRSVYRADENLVIIASDRVSAYDVILPTPIPDKGRILTQLSVNWFRTLKSATPHHLLAGSLEEIPEPFTSEEDLDGRTLLCRSARPVKAECIVRGYLAGSGFREYQDHGTLHGEPLPKGLRAGSPLDAPRFTPTTKAEEGHDEPLTWEEFQDLVGGSLAEELRERSLEIYREAVPIARRAGLILADTKFEFGHVGDELILIDECLSPDSSRFWDAAKYEAGILESFDKQFLRDYLDQSGWNHLPPAPELPKSVVDATRERYIEAARRLLGSDIARRVGLLGVEAL